MNQHQATEEVANAIAAWPAFRAAGVLTPTEGPDAGRSIVLAGLNGTSLSVTVEILAQG